MITVSELSGRLREVRERIAEAAARSHRAPAEITIVAVTKGWPEDVVRRSIQAGIQDIGENRVQEALTKRNALTPLSRFHLVGHLQRNKASKAAAIFDVVHSIDSLDVALALDAAAGRVGRILDTMIQVNVAADPAKHGLRDDEVRTLCARLEPMQGIRVVGLMTIGPLAEEPEASRPHFRALRELRDDLARDLPRLRHLSMGMSQDYVIAVEEGATLVRIGTALFGPRMR